MDFPKKQAQRLMPLYLLEYSEKLFENHPDPEAPWGGGGGSPIEAGTGIDITGDETKTISIDETVVATKTDIASMVTTTMLEDALDDYALKTDIPENVSDLNNDAGYITSNALSGYATESWVNNQGYITGITSSDVVTALGYTPGTSNFSGDYDDLTDKPDLSIYAESSDLATVATSGSYNDLIDKPTIPEYTGGTWIDISGTTISVSNPYISLIDSNNLPRVMISDHTTGTTPSFGSAKYCNISPSGFGINDRSETSSNQYTTYKHGGIKVNNAYDLAFPSQSGTIALTSDIPTDYVDLTSNQNITGIKGFTGSKLIRFFDGNNSSNKMGFTCYHSAYSSATSPSSTYENGYLESSYSDSDFSGSPSMILGMYNTNNISKNRYLGFKYQSNNNGTTSKCKLIMPITANDSNIRYFPLNFTDGTNTVYTGSDGSVNISTLFPTVPTKTSDLTNDSGFVTQTWVENQGYLTSIVASDITDALGYTPGTSNFSGSYNDLTDKPTIPTDTSELTNSAGFITSSAIPTNVSSFTNDANYVTSASLTAELANYVPSSSITTVAYTGSYNDLTGTPTIPTATSDLTNDSGFITSNDLPTYAISETTDTAVSGVSSSTVSVINSATLTQATETLTFTYNDNTTASFTFLTSGTALTTGTTSAVSSVSASTITTVTGTTLTVS